MMRPLRSFNELRQPTRRPGTAIKPATPHAREESERAGRLRHAADQVGRLRDLLLTVNFPNVPREEESIVSVLVWAYVELVNYSDDTLGAHTAAKKVRAALGAALHLLRVRGWTVEDLTDADVPF